MLIWHSSIALPQNSYITSTKIHAGLMFIVIHNTAQARFSRVKRDFHTVHKWMETNVIAIPRATLLAWLRIWNTTAWFSKQSAVQYSWFVVNVVNMQNYWYCPLNTLLIYHHLSVIPPSHHLPPSESLLLFTQLIGSLFKIISFCSLALCHDLTGDPRSSFYCCTRPTSLLIKAKTTVC